MLRLAQQQQRQSAYSSSSSTSSSSNSNNNNKMRRSTPSIGSNSTNNTNNRNTNGNGNSRNNTYASPSATSSSFLGSLFLTSIWLPFTVLAVAGLFVVVGRPAYRSSQAKAQRVEFLVQHSQSQYEDASSSTFPSSRVVLITTSDASLNELFNNNNNNNNNIPIIIVPDAAFVKKHCEFAAQRYSDLQSHPLLQNELVKYCAMSTVLATGTTHPQQQEQQQQTAVFLDTTTYSTLNQQQHKWLVDTQDLWQMIMETIVTEQALYSTLPSSLAIVSTPLQTTHAGPLLVLQSRHQAIATQMLSVLVETPFIRLIHQPFLVSYKLYQLIQHMQDLQNHGFVLWQQHCHYNYNNNNNNNNTRQTIISEHEHTASCPEEYPYCCSVQRRQRRRSMDNNGSSQTRETVLLLKHPILPYSSSSPFMQKQPSSKSLFRRRSNNNNDDASRTNTGTAVDDTSVPYLYQLPQKQREKIVNDKAAVEPYFTMNPTTNMPYISTVREQVLSRKKATPTTSQNVYDVLNDKDQLPSAACLRCIHLRKCPEETMLRVCQDYFETLCHIQAPDKPVSKQLTVSLPTMRKDPTRLIPRIVHQTFYTNLTNKTDYPNMSRLQESFRNSGWDYRFYSDDDAVLFLQLHFPPEVLQTYQALRPGAFKADLFRYCALLIHGGVYADVDILLESNLDSVVAPDIGFMVPMDQPDACVWQGFIAAAPGHPFLAKAIETVVNQVRNRFTSVDLDASFCPTPNYKVLHMFDVLFTAGPCLLGASMNRVLGRHGQTLLEPGDLLPLWMMKESDEDNVDEVKVKAKQTRQHPTIPGRTVILQQNKMDLAGHRFTWVEKNLIVAVTDLEGSDDRANAEAAKGSQDGDDDEDDDEEEAESPEQEVEPKAHDKSKKNEPGEHYSKTHAKTGIYGLVNLYIDQQRANEDIRIAIDDASYVWTWDVPRGQSQQVLALEQ